MQEKNAVCERDGAKSRLSNGTIDEKAELSLLIGDVILFFLNYNLHNSKKSSNFAAQNCLEYEKNIFNSDAGYTYSGIWTE